MPQKDKKAYNAYMKRYVGNRYHEVMDEAKAHLGGKCVECGDAEELEFDHIDPSTKNFTIGKMWSVSKKRLEKELELCQLLCKPCHLDKGIAEGSFKGA